MRSKHNLNKQNLSNIEDKINNPEAVLFLDVSSNNITSLQQFSNFISIQELKLSYNFVFDLQQVTYLSNLRNLKQLDLTFNPVSQNTEFRLFCIRLIPTLTMLNMKPVTSEEQIQSSCYQFQTPIQFPVSLDTLSQPTELLKNETQQESPKTLIPKMQDGQNISIIQQIKDLQEVEDSDSTYDFQSQQSQTQMVPTLNPKDQVAKDNTIQQSTSFQTMRKSSQQTRQLPTLSAPSMQKGGMPKQANPLTPKKENKPPINPIKKPDIKKSAEKSELQQKLMQAIMPMLDLLDIPHLTLLQENINQRRQKK
ncbi:Leucine rich repeat protein [Spironucleus salmonicida]|uniref:Leucine rich repeat protein n=1 Tax=Spironucleus salmonicida TaxID=348837 RepID=V6LNR3_9EUKA|nr:Leucine rich repeat protein [Spironucleus salmonicida]|eukprot:EST46312.1 Hypothetical protein SS50377_13699 [Spironucleus salmonicida]